MPKARMVKRVSHVGIVVRDISEVLAVYRQLFGLEASQRETRKDLGVEVAMLPVGGTQVELISPLDQEGPIARFLEKRGEGLHHIGFEVVDIEKAMQSLAAQGVPLTDQRPRQGMEGRVAFLHPRAAHGVLIELVERKPK